MKNNLMNIVLVANDSYMEHLAVTLLSILLSAEKEDFFKFYILSNDISEKSKDRLLKLRFYKNFDIEFLAVPEEAFNDLPENVHLKKQTYYRLLMPELINEDKVLYLDSDVFVKKSLKSFYNTDITNHIIAGVEDISYGKTSGNKEMMYLHNINNYFNAGILLWNLKKFREENFFEKCIEYANKYPERLLYCDQDILNPVLEKYIKYVEIINNFQYQPYYSKTEQYYKKLKKNIVAIHYVSRQKPWDFLPKFKFGLEYYGYVLLTPWKKDAFNRLFLKYYGNILIKLKKTVLAFRIQRL